MLEEGASDVCSATADSSYVERVTCDVRETEARMEDRELRMVRRDPSTGEDYLGSLASSKSNVFTSAKTSRESKVPEL